MAYNFTAASSQYLSTASTNVTDEPITIAAWARPTVVGVAHAIGSVGIVGGIGRCQMQISTVNTLRLAHIANNGTSAGTVIDGSGTVTQNTWHHCCGVFSSQTSRIAYLNGAAGTQVTTDIGTSGPFNTITTAARYNTTLGFYFTGDIAEVGIWNVALTAAEIASLAKGMTCDKIRPQNLVFYAPLVRDLQDVKGGLTITNNNNASVANHPRVYA